MRNTGRKEGRSFEEQRTGSGKDDDVGPAGGWKTVLDPLKTERGQKKGEVAAEKEESSWQRGEILQKGGGGKRRKAGVMAGKLLVKTNRRMEEQTDSTINHGGYFPSFYGE